VNAAVLLPGGIEARIGDEAVATGNVASAYPTRRLRRGLRLLDRGHDLSEEGVGFGVPVLKRGLQTVFPGGMELHVTAQEPDWQVTAVYRLDLVERITGRSGTVRPRLVYAAKDSLAAVHRRVPALRRPLTATSSALRREFGWRTVYESVDPVASVPVTYTVRGGEGVISVAAELAGVPASVTEIILMNELGAGSFDSYEDSSGASLAGAAVGTWNEVTAATASFVSSQHGLAFTLARMPGAKLLRGREAIAGRLAWAGFGYGVCPGAPSFAYDVRVERRADGGAP
jgi:hypothetical protein